MKFLSKLFTRNATTNDEIEIKNDRPTEIEVWFEPWGHPFNLLPGKTIQVKVVSSKPGSLEVVEEERLTAVYGWSKCSLSVYEGEELLFDLFELPDLHEPPSSRKVVEMLFGGPRGPR